MPKHTKSLASEVATEWRSVHRSQVQYANLVRRLEYPAVLARIRSPPVPLLLVLVGLLNALLILAVRLPLHALRHLGAPLRGRSQTPRPTLRDDLDEVRNAIAIASTYTWHWAGILGACVWLELEIVAHHALMGLLVAALYVALLMGLSWLLFFILGA